MLNFRPKEGDTVYVLTRQEHRTLYREMTCTKVWGSSFQLKDSKGRMHRFWLNDRKMIDDQRHWATLEKPKGERFVLVEEVE